jgi:hypothetical protein
MKFGKFLHILHTNYSFEQSGSPSRPQGTQTVPVGKPVSSTIYKGLSLISFFKINSVIVEILL